MLRALIAVSLLLLSDASDIRVARAIAPTVSVSNGGPWGSWGQFDLCPLGSKADGFSLKVEGRQGRGDDTALNGIRLHCTGNSGTVESLTGPWGDWTYAVWCPNNGVLTAFRLKVEPPQGDGDDTAANNIMFQCSSGQVIEGPGQEWGSYGGWSGTCDRGICGLQTKVEGQQGNGDDTALNDAQFFCCSN